MFFLFAQKKLNALCITCSGVVIIWKSFYEVVVFFNKKLPRGISVINGALIIRDVMCKPLYS
jgi:hypothetical protein